MKVTIVIPVHNEAAVLSDASAAIDRELAVVDADVDILFVENGSTDGTAHRLEDLCSSEADRSYLVLDEPDYGAAMRAGFRAAKGDVVVNFDIDYFSGSFVAAALGLEADVVIASKRDPESDDRRPLLRRAGTLVFNGLLRYGLGSNVSDTHGIKAFKRDVIESVLPQVNSSQDLFDTELVLRAERAGYRIAELPVVVEELRPARSSYLKRVPRTLRGLAQLRVAFWRESRA